MQKAPVSVYDVKLDTWFMEVIPQMLQYQRDCKVSTPVLAKRAPNASLDIHKLWLGKLVNLAQTLSLLASSLERAKASFAR